MRYQKEFEYISETIEKLSVTITNQSETLLILAEMILIMKTAKTLHFLAVTFTLLELK